MGISAAKTTSLSEQAQENALMGLTSALSSNKASLASLLTAGASSTVAQ